MVFPYSLETGQGLFTAEQACRKLFLFEKTTCMLWKITVLVNLLEKLFNKKASKINGPLIKGDVVNSKASTTKLYRNIKYKPNTRIEDGLKKFVKWFIDHKNLNNWYYLTILLYTYNQSENLS